MNPELVRAGAVLLQQLDRSGALVTSYFWFREPELDDWRLVIASPIVDTEGPTELFKKVQRALNTSPELAATLRIDAITSASPTSQLVDQIRREIHTSRYSTHPTLRPEAIVYRST